jgi:transposase
MTQRKPTPSYTAEFRTRGVRLFNENRADYATDNAAYQAIAAKLGCSHDSLRAWCQRAASDADERSGLTSEENARLKALERENRELRQANEILKKASAYFAQAELDRPFKRCPGS